jgi:hypothetical protein
VHLFAYRWYFLDEVACADPVTCKSVCDNPGGCTNLAYPKLVMELLPTGARGLMVRFSKTNAELIDRNSKYSRFLKDRCYDGCTHVFTHQHLQFHKYNIHDGHLEAHTQGCKRLGAHDRRSGLCGGSCFHIDTVDSRVASQSGQPAF